MPGLVGTWRKREDGGQGAGALPLTVTITRRGDSDFRMVLRYTDGQPDDAVMLFQTSDGGRGTLGKYRLHVAGDGQGNLRLEATRRRLIGVERISAFYAPEST